MDTTSSVPTLRARVYRALTTGLGGEGRLSFTNKVLLWLIVASIVFALIDSEETLAGRFAAASTVIEIAFGVIFLCEYLLRVWSSAEDPKFGGGLRGILRYMLTPAALLDLVALSPLFFAGIGSEAYVLRLLRLMRILRLMKIGRYSNAASAIGAAVRLRRYELGISLLAGLFLMLLAAACLYALEGHEQPDKFGSIPRAMWWSISMLTVGYGDVYPITLWGKVFASITALIGIALVAVPTGIIAAAFNEVLTRRADDDTAPPSLKEATSVVPDRATFDGLIADQLSRAHDQGRPHAEINAGELHRVAGGYPGQSHRMPVCCGALRAAMQGRDEVVHEPPGGAGASLTIRYRLPR